MLSGSKPGTVACILNFLDRRPRDTIGVLEHGTSGFGDRMRGVAYLLFLAKKHRARTVLYKETDSTDPVTRKEAFPGRLTRMIDLEGLDFKEPGNDFPEETQVYVHYSNFGNPLKRYGFPEMWRVKPKDDAIKSRIRDMAAAGPYIGFHSRATDSEHARDDIEAKKKAALKALDSHASQIGTRRVYLAADSKSSRLEWQDLLASNDFDVIESGVTFNEQSLRQTDNHDMMLDFFALAGSDRIVRIVPSEFSRFAAWIGGRRLRYHDLA